MRSDGVTCQPTRMNMPHILTTAGQAGTLSLSLSDSWSRERVTSLICSRKSQRHRGSTLNFPPGQTSWAGHCSTRCSASSSAPLQCGQVAKSRHPIWWRYPANNGEWPVRSWANITHWALVQSCCQRWNSLTLPASTLWILACGSLRYVPSATLCWCRLPQAELRSIGA